VVWVTGASSGIGRALALRYARAGWHVVATSRNISAFSSEPTEIAARIEAISLDVRNLDDVHSAISTIEERCGPIRLGILNAGIYRKMPAALFDAALIRDITETNYMGVIHCIDALLPRMIARRGGQLAVIGSMAGWRGLPFAAPYGASKAALINLCESLKLDCEKHGVSISIVNPGFVRTPLTDANDFPMPFLMEVEDAAERIVAGLERRAFSISFPRGLSLLLGMARLLPYRLYFRLIKRAVTI